MLKPTIALVLAASLPLTVANATDPLGPQVRVQRGVGATDQQEPRQGPKKARPSALAQVVFLEHTMANEVAKLLNRSLKLSRKRDDLVLIPHAEANSLLLRGTKARITEALDAIARVDVQAALEGVNAMTQIISLDYGSATEVAKTLNRFLDAKGSDDLRIEPHAPNNMLLVRGTKNRVKEALDLIARLDMKPAGRQVKPKWVVLEHTKATEVAATLIRFLDLANNAGPNRGLMVDANRERNAIVLHGTVEQTKQAIELIARIDWAAGKKAAKDAKETPTPRKSVKSDKAKGTAKAR